MRLLSSLKSAVVPGGSQARRVSVGLFRGLTFEIDLRAQTQFFLGLYERETYAWIEAAAHRCEWAIDVGAGRGELAVLLLQRPQVAAIYAFEPQESERAITKRNLGLNGLQDDPRLMLLSQMVTTAPSPDGIALDALPIDRGAHGFIKIDVDGSEMDVLRSASGLLAAPALDVLVETHSAELEDECVAYLSALGFECTVIEQAWWRRFVPELRPIPHNRWLMARKLNA